MDLSFALCMIHCRDCVQTPMTSRHYVRKVCPELRQFLFAYRASLYPVLDRWWSNAKEGCHFFFRNTFELDGRLNGVA